MGTYCDTAKTTDSRLVVGDGVVAGWAHSGLRGWRHSMEDSVVAELLSQELGVFAVFDGHGGDFCARWAAHELCARLLAVPRLQAAVAAGTAAWSEAEEVQAVATSLGEVVRRMDEDLRATGRPAWSCGTTAVILLVSPRCLTVANLGDSRAVRQAQRAGPTAPGPARRDMDMDMGTHWHTHSRLTGALPQSLRPPALQGPLGMHFTGDRPREHAFHRCSAAKAPPSRSPRTTSREALRSASASSPPGASSSTAG